MSRLNSANDNIDEVNETTLTSLAQWENRVQQ